MKILLAFGFTAAMIALPIAVQAQEVMSNPAINAETVAELQTKIAALEARIIATKVFVNSRKPDVLKLSEKIANADEDTQKIIDELNALVNEFKTGSEIQLAVEKSMQDVRLYIDKFRAGTAAQQAAAASLTETLTKMEATDASRNKQVGEALKEIRRLEAMKGDLVALKIAGSFAEMAALYDGMVKEFGVTLAETADLANALESVTMLPAP
jgi:chromosome segregation ATPase